MRAYFLTLQYWLAGSEENIGNLVRMLVDRYAGGPREALRGAGQGRPRRSSTRRSASTTRALAKRVHNGMSADVTLLPRVATSGKRGTVGLLVMRSYLLAGNAGHYDGVIAALEARGLRVDPGLRHRAGLAPGDRAVLHRERPRQASTPWSR